MVWFLFLKEPALGIACEYNTKISLDRPFFCLANKTIVLCLVGTFVKSSSLFLLPKTMRFNKAAVVIVIDDDDDDDYDYFCRKQGALSAQTPWIRP
jgi:hypothetical protein